MRSSQCALLSVWCRLPALFLFALAGLIPLLASPAVAQTITNPGFETGTKSGWLEGGQANGVNTAAAHSGSYGQYNNGGWNSVFQSVSGFSTNTAYTVTVWARLSTAVSGNNQSVYISQDGGTTKTRQWIASTSWTQFTFNFTTGTNTSVQIGNEEVNGSGAVAYVDDWTVARSGGVTIPAAPTNLSAVPGNAQVSLSWTASSGATSYNVKRSTTSGSGYANIATGVTGTTYSNTGLTNGTTYYYVVSAVNSAGESANSTQVAATPVAPTLPSGWSTLDIGGPTPAGSATESSGTYTIKGGGADIWGSSDQFRYAYKDVSGDVTVIANCTAVQNTDGWAKAGVMVRDGTGANATYAAAQITPGSGVRFQWRATTGGSAQDAGVAGVLAPRYLRIQRTGNSFTASYSSDGTNWTALGTAQTIAMATAAKAGLAVTSHLQGTLNTSTFTNVSVTSGGSSQVAAPTFSPPAGTYSTSQNVTISSATSGASIRYTTDGSTPSSTAGTLYSAPVSITSTRTLKAIAYKSGMTDSTVTSGTYTIQTNSRVCTKVRFFPRSGFASRMLNGKFTGNNTTATSAGTTLITITAAPTEGQWTELTFSNAVDYRYLRYDAPVGSYGNVAEIEFYAGTIKLAGTGFGTAGSWNNSGNTYDKALDGNTATFFDAASGDDQYVGIDIGQNPNTVVTPTFSPAPGNYSASQSVSISTITSGATIRYTTNGADPSSTTGTVYNSPVSITTSTTLKAIAYKSGMNDSAIAAGAYTIGGGPPPVGTVRVYHIGNSVTDTINYNALKTMASTGGKTYIFGRHMIPGAPLDWIWDHPADGFNEAPYGYYPNALPNYTWDAVTLQPFDRLLDSDVDYSTRYINLALQNSANSATKWYVYSRWPRKNSDGSLDYNALWLRTYTGGWDNTNETRDYFQRLVNSLRSAHPTRTILMVPAGDVLYELNNRMHNGQVPGYTDISQVYADGIHFNNFGQFIVGTTFYTTLFRTNPAGLSYSAYNGTPAITQAQADAVYNAVWSIVSNHDYAGLK